MEKLVIDNKLKENNRIEFKRCKGGLPNSFFETYSSFSNTKGGYIYLGINEVSNNLIVSSMLSLDDVLKIKKDMFDILNNPNKVSINLIIEDEVRELEYEGYFVLEVKVNPARKEFKPVYINNNIMTGTFRRNFEGDYHCSPQEIKAMIRDSNDKSIDLIVLDEMNLDDLSVETIKSYKNRFRAYHPEHVFLKENDINFLEYIGALRLGADKVYHPTVAGLLMFGYSYKIVYEFPEYFLDYQEHYEVDKDVRWSDRVTSESGDWSGNLFDFYNKVVNKITGDLKIPFKLDGIERVDETILHQALREALCNAISNSDFYQPRGLVIKKYFNHISFFNPGTLRISKEKAFKGGESDARNKTILKMFNLVGVGERAGSGIPKILDACRYYGFSLPVLKDSYNPDRTVLEIDFSVTDSFKYTLDSVTFGDTKNILRENIDESGINNANKYYNDNTRRVITYLNAYGKSKVVDIANNLNISVSGIKKILYKLVEDDVITSSGTIKDKRYCLKEK